MKWDLIFNQSKPEAVFDCFQPVIKIGKSFGPMNPRESGFLGLIAEIQKNPKCALIRIGLIVNM